MSLYEMKKGNKSIIKNIAGTGCNKQRFMDLGLYKGVEIVIKRFAPLGDPIIIEVNDTEIAIRKSDAKCIEVA